MGVTVERVGPPMDMVTTDEEILAYLRGATGPWYHAAGTYTSS